jgi:O-antigen ligase
LSILLLTEIFYSNIVFITSFFSGQYLEYLSPSYFVGIAANKNITAASLCIKTPFLLYSIFISKRVNPILGFIFLFFLFFAITVISARASFLSLFVLLSVLLFYTFYYRIKKWAQLLLYVFIPFISAILLNIYLTFEVNNNFISRVSSIEFSEESSNGRYELWKNALDYISINPIIGCGLGNWKIQSLPYWKDILFDYTVPYHAHNDFLELTTELGIFGGLSYLSIFIISSYFLFKHSLSNKNDFISVVVLSSFFVYFIDAFFNFPLERPLMQIVFLFLLFFVINLKTTNEKHL